MRISPSRAARRPGAPLLALPTALLAGFAVIGVAEFPEEPRYLAVERLSAVADSVLADNAPTHDQASDYVYDESTVVPITLSSSSATSSGPGVTVSGSTVTITAEGTYRLRGALAGQVVVDAADALVRVILDGVTITNSSNAPLFVKKADKAVVLLADGSTNTLTDATTYQYPDGGDEPDAALFSKADLTIAGTGKLTVAGRSYDGIAGKDGLVIAGGSITVDAVDDGIRGKDYLAVKGGSITVRTTSGDGLKTTEDEDAARGYVWIHRGSVSINAGRGDGISAAGELVTTGGSIGVSSGGGSNVSLPADAPSAKGLKAARDIVLGDNSNISVNSADDGVHSDADLTIEGGTIYVSTGDDGYKAEGTVSISGGLVDVSTSNEGIEGLKVDISGGTVHVDARDDAINAAEEGINEFQVSQKASITISGGYVLVTGGTDGLDSNGSITLWGGTIVVLGSPTTGGGEGAIDANGTLAFHGGIVVAAGISSSTTTPSNTSTRTFAQYTWSANQSANTAVHLATAQGQPIVAVRLPRAFRSVLVSTPSLTLGTSYNVYTGGTTIGGTPTGIVYTGGTMSGATLAGTATAGQFRTSWGFPGGGVVTVPTSTVTPTTTTRTTSTTTTTTTTRPTTTTTARPTTTTTTPSTTTTSQPVTTTTTRATTTTTTTTTSGGNGSAACSATYSIVGSWPGGFQGQVTVTAARSISSWTVGWTFGNGQTVTQAWGGVVSQSGSSVTVANAPWNGTLGAGQSTTLGFLGSWSGANTPPATVTCTAG